MYLRRSLSPLFLALGLMVASVLTASAQTSPITGNPPLSSIAGGPFDSIDLANLNVHFSIPVFSRAGKGMPFSYALSYDGLIWGTTYNSSGQPQWTPVSNWGWRGITEAATGYVTYTYSVTNTTCGTTLVETETWANFVYHDPSGVPHSFFGNAIIYDDPGCGSGHNFSPEGDGQLRLLPSKWARLRQATRLRLRRPLPVPLGS